MRQCGMARNDPQVNLRMPAEIKASIEAAAETSKRSLTSEIVARLQDSFTSTRASLGDSLSLQTVNGELEQQRALARQFRELADSSDSIRTFLASILLSILAKVPEDAFDSDTDKRIYRNVAEWLSYRDLRSAAFSVLALIDGSRPEIVEALRNFASHLEDLDLVRKPIDLPLGNSNEG